MTALKKLIVIIAAGAVLCGCDEARRKVPTEPIERGGRHATISLREDL